MSMVRVAVFAVIAVAVGGAAYVYRGEVAQRLGLGARQVLPKKARPVRPPWRSRRDGAGGPTRRGGAGGRHIGRAQGHADRHRGRRHGAVDLLGPAQVAPRQPDHEGQCRGRRAGQGRRPAVRARCPHPEGAALPDRSADPQGPGPARAGQARHPARRRPADQGRRHRRAARHQLHDAEGTRGAARIRRGDAPEHPDPDQLQRDPRAGLGPHQLDPLQGRHHAARRRQHRHGRAGHHQPGRSDLRLLRHAAGLSDRPARGDGQGPASRSTP